MALSLLSKNIRKFYDLNTKRKAIEKEEEALKGYFKAEANGMEMVFKDEVAKLEVSVALQPRTAVDLVQLRLNKPEVAKAFEVESVVMIVSVRKAKETKVAA